MAAGRNYRLNLVWGSLTFVALQFGNPQLVVPWLAQHAGLAYLAVALLVPFLQLGRLLAPVLGIWLAQRIDARRPHVVGATLVTTLVLAGIGGMALRLGPMAATVMLLGCMAVFGLANGIFAVASSDLTARTTDPDRLPRLLAHRAALGGGLTIAAVVAIHLLVVEAPGDHLMLVWIATGAWLGVMLAAHRMREGDDRADTPQASLAESIGTLRRYAGQAWCRRYLIVATLSLSVVFAPAFYAIHAATLHEPTAKNLSVLVVATGIGLILAGQLWPRVGAPWRLAAGGALLAALAALAAVAIDWVPALQTPWFHAPLFTLLAVGGQGCAQALVTILNRSAPADHRLLLIAAAAGWRAVGGLVFGALVGVLGHLQAVLTPILVIFACNLATALAATWLLRRDQPVEAG